MKNIVPEVVFKIRVRDETIKGENPYKWKDNIAGNIYYKSSLENILKDLKQF